MFLQFVYLSAMKLWYTCIYFRAFSFKRVKMFKLYVLNYTNIVYKWTLKRQVLWLISCWNSSIVCQYPHLFYCHGWISELPSNNSLTACCSSLQIQLRQLRVDRRSQLSEMTKFLVKALVSAFPDYCISLLAGRNVSLTQTACRPECSSMTSRWLRRFYYVCETLGKLPWLPVQKRIIYKIACLQVLIWTWSSVPRWWLLSDVYIIVLIWTWSSVPRWWLLSDVYIIVLIWTCSSVPRWWLLSDAPVYLADDCCLMSTLSDGRQLRSSNTGVLYLLITPTSNGSWSYGLVTWNEFPLNGLH